jgi:hypothetical protein
LDEGRRDASRSPARRSPRPPWALKVDTDLTIVISIPVVACLVALGRVHGLVMFQQPGTPRQE